MTTSLRKPLLGAASALVLGIGTGVPGQPAAAGIAVNPPAGCPSSHSAQRGGSLWPDDAQWVEQRLRKDNIRWAQVELRDKGLYRGSLDGVLGPQTKQALRAFQQNSGLGPTASLDRQTWEALTGEATAAGSSMPPIGDNDTPAANRPATSDLGR